MRVQIKSEKSSSEQEVQQEDNVKEISISNQDLLKQIQEKDDIIQDLKRVRIVIGRSHFSGLVKLMEKMFHENQTTAKKFAIEYNADTKELFVDLAEESEEVNVL